MLCQYLRQTIQQMLEHVCTEAKQRQQKLFNQSINTDSAYTETWPALYK